MIEVIGIMLLTREELLNTLKDFNVYEILPEIKGSIMEFNSLNDLISYALANNINSILYRYLYLYEEMLSITDETFKELHLNSEIIHIIQNDVDEYNGKLKNLDYSTPIGLEIYCIYNGMTFYFEDKNYWFLEMGYGFPKDDCVSIIEKYENKINEEFSKKSEKIIEGRNKLEEIIMEDINFYNCTNHNLRRKYAVELMDSGKVDKFLFYKEQGGLIDYTIETFIEYIWRKYKDNIEAYRKLNK
jgi:hypothetical protein